MIDLNKKSKEFTEIYNDYFSLILRNISLKVGNDEEALDICQEVFVRFYEKFDEISNPKNWLFGALRLVVFEYYRRKNKNDININDILYDINLTFENKLKEMKIIVKEAFNDMVNFKDEKEKLLFEHIAIHKLSYYEAGQELGFSKRQAKYRYRLVLNRLMNYFIEKGIRQVNDLYF
jgi:RNA polymerase sigma factor (sigma-70 family)